jgi:predicted alpha/beta superfamily hydrolase
MNQQGAYTHTRVPAGTGQGGFRGDAERWPGGGCEGYMRRLVQELMPLVTATFNTATDPARVAFGGGSFAGAWAAGRGSTGEQQRRR